MFLKMKFYGNTEMPIYLYIIYVCVSTMMAELDGFFEDHSIHPETFNTWAEKRKSLLIPKPTQINNSRYDTQRLTEEI